MLVKVTPVLQVGYAACDSGHSNDYFSLRIRWLFRNLTRFLISVTVSKVLGDERPRP